MEKLQNSELKIMEVLWENGEMPARKIAEILEQRQGWNINTTYTLIKRIANKNLILRTDPGFICTPVVKKKEVEKHAVNELAQKLFGGSTDLLFSSLLSQKGLSDEKIAELQKIIDEENSR